MTIIIGIDPGSRKTGYGVIQQIQEQLRFLDAGTICTDNSNMPERLQKIFFGVHRVVEYYQKYYDEPMLASIEQVFMSNNPDSALKLGQARGAAIAALVAKNLTVFEYTARQIKQAICGYGAADKSQVQTMMVKLLNLSVTPQTDASDGLACAVCHAYHNHNFHKLLIKAGADNHQILTKTLNRSKKKGRWRLS